MTIPFIFRYDVVENLSISDNVIILIYFAMALAIGLFASFGKDKNVKDYFLAGKEMGWVLVGASLFATNISIEHFVGLAGAGSIHGLSVGHFEWLAVIFLFLLGWVFAPIFLRENVYTMPEFLGRKFGDKTRDVLTAVSLAAYFFIKIGVTIIAGGFLLSKILGLDMFTSAVFIVLLTGIYTVIGGLSSVMKTQLFQTVVLVTGSLLLTIYGLKDIGGISTLTEKLPESYFSIFKPSSDPDFPWTGILFGAPILGIWYWCTDQYIVQRILSARGLKDARKGTALAALLKLVPILLLITPGLIAAIKYPSIKGDAAFAYLISGDLLPQGIKGLVIAGLFAAMMSSLSSAFNSSAMLIAMDIYKPRKPKISEGELILVGRLATIFMVVLAIIFIPFLKLINTQIYIFLQTIQAFISPPIASAFLLGIFWTKAKSSGVFWALIIGGVLGLSRIITSLINPSIIENIQILYYYNSIHYLHFAAFLFIVSSAVLIVVSLVAKENLEKSSDINLNKLQGELELDLKSAKIRELEAIGEK